MNYFSPLLAVCFLWAVCLHCCPKWNDFSPSDVSGQQSLDLRSWPSYVVPFVYSLTTIHTWPHLALTAHMKVGWVNDPQVALMTLKIRTHIRP